MAARRPRAPRTPRNTEVDAYIWIKDTLKTLGWDTRNPARTDGQVYTQNEALAHPEIQRMLVLQRPEAIVQVTDTDLWVIEAKRDHRQLDQAEREAEGYARDLNASPTLKARLVSGVAGNALDSFLTQTRYFNGTTWVPVMLNGIEVTGILTPEQARQIVTTGNPDLTLPTIDEKLFLSRATHINQILHLGAVNPHKRAGVMAALLLAMIGDTPPNINERNATVLIGDINSRVQAVLRQQGKSEFYHLIEIDLPTTPDNHVKFRQALVDTIQELNTLNIRSAMNSGADWLGAYYEVFLKYANWAQDLGIVLTPRHVTRFVADVLDVRPSDTVYDPTCGTGGFLVAAFDQAKLHADTDQLNRFKQHGVFGVEQDAGVAALAVVNMIFRGDGKNNIIEGNCFARRLTLDTRQTPATARFVAVATAGAGTGSGPATKVMMNPPFALRSSDEKEYRFVDHALAQMEHGGTLFSVLPYSTMVRPGGYLTWRRTKLLLNHTLLAVITLPSDLFYPVGVHTIGVFIKKGTPHPTAQPVLWMRAATDGFAMSKGTRLPSTRVGNHLNDARSTLRAFLHDRTFPVPAVDKFQKVAPINHADPLLELVPENYLDQAAPTAEEVRAGVQQVIRECVAFLVRESR